jgi:hypothetical protein
MKGKECVKELNFLRKTVLQGVSHFVNYLISQLGALYLSITRSDQ